MNESDKQLLFQDLSRRVRYEVKVSYETIGWKSNIQILTYDVLSKIEHNPDLLCKPYLFPFSSITETQLHEVQEILGNEVEVEHDFIKVISHRRNTFSYLELDALFDWFDRNHIDYRGLIPKNLAYNATKLNVY